MLQDCGSFETAIKYTQPIYAKLSYVMQSVWTIFIDAIVSATQPINVITGAWMHHELKKNRTTRRWQFVMLKLQCQRITNRYLLLFVIILSINCQRLRRKRNVSYSISMNIAAERMVASICLTIFFFSSFYEWMDEWNKLCARDHEYSTTNYLHHYELYKWHFDAFAFGELVSKSK